MKLKELSDLIGGRITGDHEVEITGAAGVNEAKPGDITFLADKKLLKDLLTSKASAVIAREKIEDLSVSILISDNPYFTFARALEVFYRKPFKPLGVSDKATVCRDVSFGEDVSIYPNVYISNNVAIGSRVTMFPGVFIGEGTSIGDDSIIYSNVTIRENVTVGKNVIIHAGAVIGSDGFGYVFEKGVHYKIPQVGGVIIEDDVEIGANVTIDRATTGNTIIGSGTKIDNLVHIAHNVKIGKNCIILGQVGVAGSAEIGEGVILAGQSGVRDHVKIGNGAMIGSKAGISDNIPDGQIYSGFPAIPHKTWLRAQSIYSKLPEYIKRLQELERKITSSEEVKESGSEEDRK
ncbi:MAG: UDP-3-O-(3-hydroxymyristoyl)glucosamine N-acyltransferase [Nitrospirae bacterium]|nr:UDP-3-O-(3-hydroxymyristoyl)glucosamine N-acyltransferase [Nitrospirota bacterium]